MIIVAVDPGTTTGLVQLLARGRDAHRVLDHAQLGFDDAVHWLEGALTFADVLAVERFTISQRTLTGSRSGSNDAMHMIGACRAMRVRYRVVMELQAPADAKAAFNDSVLRSIGVYNQVSGTHARDALRHALLASRRHGVRI